jgi:cytidine deaminase
MCREFLTASCDPDAEVVVAGSKDPVNFTTKALREILPCPSVYRGRDQPSILAFGRDLGRKVAAPPDRGFAAAYKAAVEKACSQKAQLNVFPVVFAAAVHFEDGRVYCVSELKGMEYGCTVDAVTLLMPEIIRAHDEKQPAATCVVQADQFGVAHAPFAAARTLMVEHGFTHILCSAHDEKGDWTVPMTASDSLPGAFTEW